MPSFGRCTQHGETFCILCEVKSYPTSFKEVAARYHLDKYDLIVKRMEIQYNEVKEDLKLAKKLQKEASKRNKTTKLK